MSIKEFTIDRRIWLRGIKGPTVLGPSGSYLLRELDQKRCCLGIYLTACGISDAELEGVASPGYLARHNSETGSRIPGWLLETKEYLDVFDGVKVDSAGNSIDGAYLMEINDDDTTADADKEVCITNKFAEHGIKVTFV